MHHLPISPQEEMCGKTLDQGNKNTHLGKDIITTCPGSRTKQWPMSYLFLIFTYNFNKSHGMWRNDIHVLKFICDRGRIHYLNVDFRNLDFKGGLGDSQFLVGPVAVWRCVSSGKQ